MFIEAIMYIESILYTIYILNYYMNPNTTNEQTNDNIIETLISTYLNNPRTAYTSPASLSRQIPMNNPRTVPPTIPRTVPTSIPRTQPTGTPQNTVPSHTETFTLYNNLLTYVHDMINGYNTNIGLTLELLHSIRMDLRMATSVNSFNAQTPLPTNPQRRYFGRNNFTTRTQPVQLFNTDLLSLFNREVNFSGLNDVVVSPTSEQLNTALETITYRATDNIASRCPITLEEFADGDSITRIRHCGHTFNTQSIRNWFSCRVRCPVCRYDIRDYTANEITDSSSNNTTTDTSNNVTTSDISNNIHNPLSEYRETINSIEQTIDRIRPTITNLVNNFFTTPNSLNSDLSNNSFVYTFEIPIVTYDDSDIDDVDIE